MMRKEVYGSGHPEVLRCILMALERPDLEWFQVEIQGLKETFDHSPLPNRELYPALLALCRNPRPNETAAMAVLGRIKAFDADEQPLCEKTCYTRFFPYVSSLVRRTNGEPSQTPLELAIASGSELMQRLLAVTLMPEAVPAEQLVSREQQNPDPRWLETNPDRLLTLLDAAKFNAENSHDHHLLFLIATHQHPVFTAVAKEVPYTQECLGLWLPTTELANFDYTLHLEKKTFFEWLVYNYPETGAADKLLTQKILQDVLQQLRTKTFGIHLQSFAKKLVSLLKAGLSLKALLLYSWIKDEQCPEKDITTYFCSLFRQCDTCLRQIRWFDNGALRKVGWLPSTVCRYLFLLSPYSFNTVIMLTREFIYCIQSSKDNPKRDPRIAELYAVFAEEPMNILAPKHLEIFTQWCNLVMQSGLTLKQLRGNVKALPLKVFLLQSSSAVITKEPSEEFLENSAALMATANLSFFGSLPRPPKPRSTEMKEFAPRPTGGDETLG